MGNQYIGKLRWIVEYPDVSSDDVRRISRGIGVSCEEAKQLCQQQLDPPRLQQFDGDDWVDLEKNVLRIKICVEDLIDNNK